MDWELLIAFARDIGIPGGIAFLLVWKGVPLALVSVGFDVFMIRPMTS